MCFCKYGLSYLVYLTITRVSKCTKKYCDRFFHQTCNSLATLILQYVSHNSDLLLYKYILSFKADLLTKNCLGKFILSETSTFVI